MIKENKIEFDTNWYELWMKQSKEFYESAEKNLKDMFNKINIMFSQKSNMIIIIIIFIKIFLLLFSIFLNFSIISLHSRTFFIFCLKSEYFSYILFLKK